VTNLRKGLVGFLLIIAMIAAGAYLLYTPEKTTVAISRVYNVTGPGQIIEVNITVNNVDNLYAWTFDIKWDPYILRVATGDSENGFFYRKENKYYNIYEGPFLKNVSQTRGLVINFIHNDKGEIIAIGTQFITQASAGGSGVLATIQFEVINVGTTTIEIDPEMSVLMNSQQKHIDFEIANGLITDKPYTPPPMWESKTFQVGTILTEIIVLTVASVIVMKITSPPPERGEEEKEIEKALEEIGELDEE